MKIADVQTTLLTGPCTHDPFLSEVRKRRSAAFIEIRSDEGIFGVGETYAGYFCPEVVPQVVDFFKPILMGQPLDDIRQLWERMYQCGNYWCRVGLGLAVLNGIEAALWDLLGKIKQVPVYQLLGGTKHERLLCYATGGPSNGPFDRLSSKIEYYLSLGFNAAKLGAGWLHPDGSRTIPDAPNEAADLEGSKVAAVRRHFGNDLGLMLDGHMGNSPGHTWDLATAQAVMSAVEPYGLIFFEEPLHYLNVAGYAELCSTTEVPIAAGECLTGVSEWQGFIEKVCCDVGQPDASFTGGMVEFLKIAKMFAARGGKIATHAWGAAASLMQNVHCGFAATNTCILEVPPDFGPLHSELLGDSFCMKDGYILPPQTPGLGVQLTDAIKQRYPFVPGSGEFNSVPGKVLQE